MDNYLDSAYYRKRTRVLKKDPIRRLVKASRSVRLNPGNPRAYYILGFVFEEQGKYDMAIRNYQRVILLRPKYLNAYLGWIEMLGKKGKNKEALKICELAVQDNPVDYKAYQMLGVYLEADKQYETALSVFIQADQLKPNEYLTYLGWGAVLEKLNKPDEAIEKYKGAIMIESNSEAHHKLAIVLYHQQKYEEAVSEFKETLDLDPNWENAHVNLGLSFYQLGRSQEADECFSHGAKLVKKSVKERYLGWISGEVEKFEGEMVVAKENSRIEHFKKTIDGLKRVINILASKEEGDT